MTAKKLKPILNLTLANYFIEKGFPIVRVTPSHKLRGKVVFFFNDTIEFQKAFKEYKEFKNNNK